MSAAKMLGCIIKMDGLLPERSKDSKGSKDLRYQWQGSISKVHVSYIQPEISYPEQNTD